MSITDDDLAMIAQSFLNFKELVLVCYEGFETNELTIIASENLRVLELFEDGVSDDEVNWISFFPLMVPLRFFWMVVIGIVDSSILNGFLSGVFRQREDVLSKFTKWVRFSLFESVLVLVLVRRSSIAASSFIFLIDFLVLQ
ncbi:hypothetical protein L1887_16847 [Cichorium endivia]|nr:hypothetical protein L1887_16847 [Cichorium endivia]